MSYRRIVLAAAVAALLPVPTPAVAQVAGDPDHEWCDDRSNWGGRRAARYCEVREFTVEAGGSLAVESRNGGIEVEGWDRNEIRVVARVQAWSRDDDPMDIVREITIRTGRRISADVPRFGRRNNEGGAAVSYRLMVPDDSDLSLETVNGGISVLDVRGTIDVSAVNGGLRLVGVSGDVRGRTTNGGINVELDGQEWSGRGLDVETTNGGVTLLIPDGFRAELTTGTVNGGFEIDFPITVQGRISRRRITTDLNGGGPPIRAVTTNGGVRVRRT